MSEATDIVLTLSRAEALVLFDWLAGRSVEGAEVDEATQTVLWRVEGALEKELVEILEPNYPEEIAKAKRAVAS